MKTVGTGIPGQYFPPRRGMSLGWRLALYTSAIVTIVMGTVTVAQEIHEIRHELREIDTGLRDSLLPVVSEIEQAADLAEIRSDLSTFHDAYVAGGNRDHQLVLRDGDGRIIMASSPDAAEIPSGYSHAVVPVFNETFAGGRADLTVLQADDQFRANVRQRWRRWAVHVGVTLVSIFLILQITIRRLVTIPLERLLEGIRKTEMGYWGDVDPVGGAWEIQWISQRFRNMGHELQQTVQHLLDAERKASTLVPRQASANSNFPSHDTASGEIRPKTEGNGFEHYLERQCRELEAASDRGPRSLKLARMAIGHLAFDAERLGNMALKTRLEDAAVRMLEPAVFQEIRNHIEELGRSHKVWLDQCRQTLDEALQQRMVPVHSLQYRQKHTGGIWKKMRTKGLNLDQVHDLFALRVVVPTETDCYWALRVIHDTFPPVIGRFKDYIATPKSNGYQSIHTSVLSESGPVIEIQIRSLAMHRKAEHGEASHLSYKVNDIDPTIVTAGSATWGRRLLARLRRWV